MHTLAVLSYIAMGEYIGHYDQHKALNNRLIYGAIIVNIPYMIFIACPFQACDQKNGHKMSVYLQSS